MFPVLQVSKRTLKFFLRARQKKSLCFGVQENQKAGLLAIYNFIFFLELFFFFLNVMRRIMQHSNQSFFFAFLYLQLSVTITSWQTRSNEDKKLNTLGDSSTACYSHYCLLCPSTLSTHTQTCTEENSSANYGPFSLLHIFGVRLFSPCMMSLLACYCNTCRSDAGNGDCMTATLLSGPLFLWQNARK